MAPFNARDRGRNPKGRTDVVLTKNLPLGYEVASSVLAGIYEKRGTAKNLIYNHKRLHGFRFNNVRRAAYALVFEALKHQKIIDALFERTKLLEVTKLDRWVASILTYDLLFGEKLVKVRDDCKPAQLIKERQEVLFKALKKLRKDPESKVLFSCLGDRKTLPRYVRINTIVATTDNIIRHLTKNGFHQVTWEPDIPFSKFLEVVQSLNKNEFAVDYHFSDLLVFHPVNTLHNLKIHQNGSIILQDKTSMFPVRMLDPPPNSIVFDACAAPGIKTSHLAALMNNTGTIYATDQNAKRIKILDKTLQHASVENCLFNCCNFSFVDPNDEPFSKTEYILLDPSCSGSGMVSRMDDLTDDAESKTMERILKLQSFQVALLKQALAFPCVKRVVYSTCSVSEEENEEVVKQALTYFPKQYKVINSFPEWPCRGSDKYKFGGNCVRANPFEHLTNGFFVAVLERRTSSTEVINPQNEEDASIEPHIEENVSMKKNKKKLKHREIESTVAHGISNTTTHEHDLLKKEVPVSLKQNKITRDGLPAKNLADDDASSRKHKKKSKKRGKLTEEVTGISFNEASENYDDSAAGSNRKKKKNEKCNSGTKVTERIPNEASESYIGEFSNIDETSTNLPSSKKSKKKKRKHSDVECKGVSNKSIF